MDESVAARSEASSNFDSMIYGGSQGGGQGGGGGGSGAGGSVSPAETRGEEILSLIHRYYAKLETKLGQLGSADSEATGGVVSPVDFGALETQRATEADELIAAVLDAIGADPAGGNAGASSEDGAALDSIEALFSVRRKTWKRLTKSLASARSLSVSCVCACL